MTKRGIVTEQDRRNHVHTLALLARMVVLAPPTPPVRRLFIVLTAEQRGGLQLVA